MENRIILNEESLEKVVGGEGDGIRVSEEDEYKLMDKICIHCNGKLELFFELQIVSACDTTYRCPSCGSLFTFRQLKFGEGNFWLDQGVLLY